MKTKSKSTFAFAGIFLVLSMLSLISAHTGEDNFNHHSMMGGIYGYGGMFFGWLFGILIIIALVLFIVWLIKQIQEPKQKK